MVVAVVAVVLLPGNGGGVIGGGGDARSVAQAYADAINDRKSDTSLYCEEFRQKAEAEAENLPEGMPTDFPDLSDLKLSASVGEVTESGETATAAINVESEFAGQKISGTHKLKLVKESGDWKVCDIDFDL